jgi:hypothetical protein
MNHFQKAFFVLFLTFSCSESKIKSPYPDLQFDDFISSLANISASVLKRDRQDIIQSLVLTLGAQGIARQVSKTLRRSYHPDRFKVCEMVPCNRISAGIQFSGLVYEPSFFDQDFCKENCKKLADFDVLSSERDATFLRPSYILLRSKLEAVTWLVIRGTTSVDDLLTNLATIAIPFLDGYAHKGILKAADSICRIVRKHLIKGDRIWLTGHSLGGATAAICTGPPLPSGVTK